MNISIRMLHVDIYHSYVNIIFSLVDITYLACRPGGGVCHHNIKQEIHMTKIVLKALIILDKNRCSGSNCKFCYSWLWLSMCPACNIPVNEILCLLFEEPERSVLTGSEMECGGSHCQFNAVQSFVRYIGNYSCF